MTNAISSDGIAATLKHFDELPDSAHVDTDVVAAIFGCSISTVRRRVKAGELPAPQKVGHLTRFRVGDVRFATQKLTPFTLDDPERGFDAGALHRDEE
ncbi:MULTISPECIES: helix-turn-helix transcriptional regulator [Ralstonia]|jgi:predicted DNA-binding transcriptional regulator AlpA|uniref:helix-turn-helix transcriptional regulator n=1 Tax=Ralstonia pickettii TaxID=329 RepID=UPI0008189A8D|nr:helix-turn-helix domain-containing protein [Ralstonia pickettii]OCS50800.1 hypothetical protein BEK68_09680 [Ralstonia pickettii]